jgi:hypothetical protein
MRAAVIESVEGEQADLQILALIEIRAYIVFTQVKHASVTIKIRHMCVCLS